MTTPRRGHLPGRERRDNDGGHDNGDDGGEWVGWQTTKSTKDMTKDNIKRPGLEHCEHARTLVDDRAEPCTKSAHCVQTRRAATWGSMGTRTRRGATSIPSSTASP